MVIARCTRNGVTSWQQVARQLGRSVDSVRCAYDPQYLKVRPWPHPCEEVASPVEPELELEPTDLSSPHPKGESLKVRILKLLAVQSMSSEILAHALNVPRNSIRARLDRLLDAGKVCHDGRYPRTWAIAGQSPQVAVTPISGMSELPIVELETVPKYGAKQPRAA